MGFWIFLGSFFYKNATPQRGCGYGEGMFAENVLKDRA
jgi:hypothetical protein